MHLGPRVSALLDGQLPPAEAERAWAHVHRCHLCRDLVEREGWIKTRLSGLSTTSAVPAPDHLKGSLRCGAPSPIFGAGRGAGFGAGSEAAYDDRPRRVALALLGGSAAGVAVLGVLALGVGAPDAPAPTRQPVTNLGGATDAPRTVPAVPGTLLRPADQTRR